MITATVSYNEDCISLKLTGHAGAAEEGKDTICSAASILAYTVAQTVKFMAFKGFLLRKPHITLREGKALITAFPTAEGYEEVFHTFFVAQVGYELLQHNYPDFVSLKIQQIGKTLVS